VNALLGWIDYPLAHQLGWALLHSLWQGALVGAVFGVLRFALRRRSANARYLAGCLCLALLLAGPALTLLDAPMPSTTPHAATSIQTTSPGDDLVFLRPAGPRHAHTASSAYSWPQWSAESLGRLAPLLAAAWLLGVAFFSARLSRSCWWIRSLRLRDNEPLAREWLETLNDLRLRLGVSRPVRLLKSTLVEVPTVIGWLRPVILVPTATLSGLPPYQLEALLAHELAHIRRHDCVVNAFQCLVETLMFYHPATWWISHCISEERENCCDDVVIEVCSDRLAYARALAAMESLRADQPSLAFAANGGSLVNRIRRLLGVSSEAGAITIRQVSGLALLGIGLLLIVLGIRAAVSPTIYQSSVRVRVVHEWAGGPGDQWQPSPYDPYFIQTEFELLQSEVMLGKVIETLDLNKAWGDRYRGGDRLRTPESLALLKSRLAFQAVPRSNLIEIRVSSDQPNEAARIANAIAEAYQEHRQKQHRDLARGGIEALQQRYANQEEKVKKAQQQVDALRVDLNISDVAATGEGPAPLMTGETLRKLESLRLESLAEYDRQRTLLAYLAQLRTNSGQEALAQVIPSAVSDTLLSTLLEHQATAEQQLAALSKEYGPEHSEVVKVKSQIEVLQRKIQQRTEGIMLGLEARVLSMKNSLDNFEAAVVLAKTNDVAEANRTRPYFEAKRTLDELQRFRSILEMKLASEKIDDSLPRTKPVEIVDRAVPPLRPISPNLPRAMALVVLGVLLDVLALLMLNAFPRTATQARAA
jgi:uncharacterized protein involved in exopolysaccharide biosynthesis/beta-lactamase regulating signal transducer with metallopeptidase domain